MRLNFFGFILLAATLLYSAAAQSIYPGQHSDKIKIASAPVKAKSFDLKDVRLLPGRVHDNLSRDSAWMTNISVERLVHSFRNNAGVYAGLEGGYESIRKFGGWESLDCDLRGHTTGHLLSAYGLMYAATGDALFKAKGDSIVSILADVQQALGQNGYLSAFPEQLIERNIKGERVWAPWYTLHKILSGLIDQYLYADNTQALDVAVKMGDWAYSRLKNIPDDTRRLMLRNEFGGINEAFYNLFSITGNPFYRQLAEFFYHNQVIDPLKEGNTDFGTKHTNTFIPKVIGEARRYEINSDTSSRDLARLFWNEMTRRHAFATGSISQKEHFFDPDKMSEYLNGYTGESCCTYNMLKLSRHLFCWEPTPEVAEYYERALYNHILAQQDPESGMVCYFLPMLTGAFKLYSTPEHSFWCCVGSGFESHAKYAESIYYHNDDTLFVNLFIPSRLTWNEKNAVITQTTSFPESDTTTFTFDNTPDGNIRLALRYPKWCDGMSVKINGKSIRVNEKPGSYVTIERKWKKGDQVTVTYPMRLRVERTPDNRQRGALCYGPVVLAGNLGTEGMTAPAPFSDPTVRNDYYTYDFKVPQNLPTHITVAPGHEELSVTPTGKPLHFITSDSVAVMPLYDLHRSRYVVYWDIDE